jgi:DNA-binding GntR family transcriptional regulator
MNLRPTRLEQYGKTDNRMQNLGAQHKNLDQKVYHILKQMITDRKLLPGEKISQEKLARELGISRTPLISALKYLETEKLIEAIPRRGFFVRVFTKEEMANIFELREVLEGLAARRAARYISEHQVRQLKGFFQQFDPKRKISNIAAYSKEDRRFHHFVIDIGSKEFLKSILENYNIISFSYQVATSEGLIRPPDQTIHEHLAVIDAIVNRNPDKAENLMRLHLKKTILYLKKDDI